MKWALLIFALIGVALIVLGLRAMNESGQSADVRAGGAFPILLGIVVLGADAIAAIIYAVVT